MNAKVDGGGGAQPMLRPEEIESDPNYPQNVLVDQMLALTAVRKSYDLNSTSFDSAASHLTMQLSLERVFFHEILTLGRYDDVVRHRRGWPVRVHGDTFYAYYGVRDNQCIPLKMDVSSGHITVPASLISSLSESDRHNDNTTQVIHNLLCILRDNDLHREIFLNVRVFLSFCFTLFRCQRQHHQQMTFTSR